MRYIINPFTRRLDAFSTSSSIPAETLTGDSGGAVGPDGVGNISILGGAGITIAGNPGTNTLTVTNTGVSGVWTRVAGTTQALANNQGFINTNAGLTTFTLPITAAVGTIIQIIGEGAGGWKIAQNAGQNIQVNNTSSTVGVLGYISSLNRYDLVTLTCRVANTTWAANTPNILTIN